MDFGQVSIDRLARALTIRAERWDSLDDENRTLVKRAVLSFYRDCVQAERYEEAVAMISAARQAA